MGDSSGELLRVGRKQPMRAVLIPVLEPWNRGSERVRLLLGRGASVGELPLHASGPSVAEA